MALVHEAVNTELC